MVKKMSVLFFIVKKFTAYGVEKVNQKDKNVKSQERVKWTRLQLDNKGVERDCSGKCSLDSDVDYEKDLEALGLVFVLIVP